MYCVRFSVELDCVVYSTCAVYRLQYTCRWLPRFRSSVRYNQIRKSLSNKRSRSGGYLYASIQGIGPVLLGTESARSVLRVPHGYILSHRYPEELSVSKFLVSSRTLSQQVLGIS